MLETARQATAFEEAMKGVCPMSRPINSGRHVYSNWDPVIHQVVQVRKMAKAVRAGRKA